MQNHPIGSRIPVATDAAIFTIHNGTFCVLLIQMKKNPFKDQWALPGGLLETTETSKTAALRILKDQTGITDAFLEQLGTFDDPKRDPLGRVVSIAYVALVPHESILLHTTSKYADVRWWPVDELPKLAYDHAEITRMAVERIRAKIGYANIAWSLLPAAFPLSALRNTYEIILGRSLDKRNFIKKVLLQTGLLEPTGEKGSGAHRPAKLYRFKQRKPSYVDIL